MSDMTLQECKKRRFILEQCLINSIGAAITFRSERFYKTQKQLKLKKSDYDLEKTKFRKDFAEAIIKASKKIISSKPNQRNILIKAINEIVTTLETHKRILAKNQPSFGIAQKALNLFLKYLWCLEIPNISKCPPHCPIDSQVLDEIKKGREKKPKWFHFNQKAYETAIDKIQHEIKPQLLAEWELSKWESSLEVCIAPLFD
jgi:hypothetical protein